MSYPRVLPGLRIRSFGKGNYWKALHRSRGHDLSYALGIRGVGGGAIGVANATLEHTCRELIVPEVYALRARVKGDGSCLSKRGCASFHEV